MLTNRKQQNIILLVVGLIAILGLIFGSFFDKQITANLHNESNIFGITFTALGVMPSLLLGTFASSILIFAPRAKNQILNVVIKIIGVGSILLFAFSLVNEVKEISDFDILNKHEKLIKILTVLLVVLIESLILFFTFKTIKKLDKTIMIQTAFTMIIIIALYAVGVEVIKYIASRPRPRVVSEGIIEFRAWYDFAPFNAFKSDFHDCKSFVSGHAANSACTITLVPLALSLTKCRNEKRILIAGTSVAALFAIATSFSRIVAGAHYLSDVAGGLLVSVIFQAVILNLFSYLNKKYIKEDTLFKK